MITLSQTIKGGMAMTNHTISAIATHINSLLAVKKVTSSRESTEPIRVRAVHRYPSNNLGIYTGTAAEAEVLKARAQEWLPVFSKDLTIKPDFFPIVVHGISTSFNPQNPDHLSELAAANYPMLQDVVSVKWLNQKAVGEGKAFSSILITLKDKAIAETAVKNSIWHGFRLRRTEHARRPPPRCMNCCKLGHTAARCPNDPLFPYCALKHHTHSCPKRGTVAMKCTACARRRVESDPTVNLKTLFSDDPSELCHSPLDPACPARTPSPAQAAPEGAAGSASTQPQQNKMDHDAV